MPGIALHESRVETTVKTADPFFETINCLMQKDENAIRNILAGKASARRIGIFPTILLHQRADLDFIQQVAKNYRLENSLGHLARMASGLAQIRDTRKGLKEEYEAFLYWFNSERKPIIDSLGEVSLPSAVDHFSVREFSDHYFTYRHFLYDGKITEPVA